MRKENKKNTKKQIVKYEYNGMSQEHLIDIQAEAYYKAFKRIEQEKANSKEAMPEKIPDKKGKWYNEILFLLNVLFWPWRINKRFRLNNRICDSILLLFVSGALQLVGFFVWVFGITTFICEICQVIATGVADVFVTALLGILALFLGSTFILAGQEFSKENDSNKIYAYSACIIALISCVVGIISLIKMQ